MRWLPLLLCLPALGADGFLTRDGAQLWLDGRPYRAVGVNKHELLDLYLAGGEALATARASLDALAALGVNVVRVRATSFWPAQIERTWLTEDARPAFWAAFDQMLADLEARGIRIVPTIAWHFGAWSDLGHHSLEEFVGDPLSPGRRLFDEWLTALVSRYRERTVILFWELTNEANLLADLRPQFELGVIPPHDLSKPHAHLVTDPVVRDRRNHLSADELAAWCRETAFRIKSLDPNHLIGSGFSAPRPAAWHLWLGSLNRLDRCDWTRDSAAEQALYLRLTHPDPIDLVSIHHYVGKDAALSAIAHYRRVADAMGKPLYIGEAGMSPAGDEPAYARPAAREGLRTLLEGYRTIDVPLVLLWTWDEHGRPAHEPILRPDDPDTCAILQAAQAAARADAEPMRAPDDSLEGRLEPLTATLRRCAAGE